jgi:hypothetical protein
VLLDFSVASNARGFNDCRILDNVAGMWRA